MAMAVAMALSLFHVFLRLMRRDALPVYLPRAPLELKLALGLDLGDVGEFLLRGRH